MSYTKLFPKNFVYLLLIAAPLLFVSCSKNNTDSPVEPAIQSRGQVLSVTSLGTYTKSTIQAFVNLATGGTQTSITVQFDVDAYKVLYVTVDPKGNLVKASGALFIPKGKNNLSLASLHHGTISARADAPSENPTKNSLEGLISASLGYYSLEADYLGLGESTILHPYIYEKSSADAVIDFIRAGRAIASTKNISLNGQVFLAGYSEGGYVTLAAQKEIEQNYRGEINITASAPMAGPYDLNLTARTILQNSTYPQPGYLAYIFLSYNNIYGWNKIGEMFNEPYASSIPSLFDGTKNLDQINAALTTDLTKLLKKDFVDSFLNGSRADITAALTENSLLDWTPIAPIKLFHGNADDYVPYQNSVEALNAFEARGSNVELVTINGGTHITSAVPSIIGAVTWFESLRLSKIIANN